MADAEHRMTWYVYAGTERIRRTSTMRGTWDYDAVCSCGWDSAYGGALEREVRRAVDRHRAEVAWDAEQAAAPADARTPDQRLREALGLPPR